MSNTLLFTIGAVVYLIAGSAVFLYGLFWLEARRRRPGNQPGMLPENEREGPDPVVEAVVDVTAQD